MAGCIARRTVASRPLTGGHERGESSVPQRTGVRPVGEFRARDSALRAGLAENEIVLWFEADLYDQLQIIQILEWLAGQEHPHVSMVCIGAFPGVPGFVGLGQLTPDQLGGLFPGRTALSPAQLDLASRAWQAVTAPTPHPLNTLTRADTSALEFLGPALIRLLAEYPLTNNGLGETERHVLRALSAGPMSFARLFPLVQGMEVRPFMGDSTLWTRILALARGARPTVTVGDLDVQITPFGLECLNGMVDFVAANGIDRWIGGVHLTAESEWRWDPRARAVGEFPTRNG